MDSRSFELDLQTAAQPPASESRAAPRRRSHLFAVVCRGSSGSHWLAKVLNAHPEILCLHSAREKLVDPPATKHLRLNVPSVECRDLSYLERLLYLGDEYAAVGDVHGISYALIPPAKE